MFDQIFGNYLVSANRLTSEQLKEVIEQEKSIRVKLGLIAVAEKLMTQEQADEVNRLQAIMDKRFGDIAVEKGYLTEEQIGQLLKKQGNVYMLFVQTIIDKGYLTLDDIDNELLKYQEKHGFTHSDMDDLVSGDIDRTVRLFLPNNSEYCNRICGIAIRTIIRLIDSGAYVSKAFLVDELKVDNCALQQLAGDYTIWSGFAGTGDSLLSMASVYADEEFEKVDLDALDAIGEFTNCINGLFASEVSHENVNVDMLPPNFKENPATIRGKQFCVFPITIQNKVVHFILSIDSDFSIE